MSHEAAAASLGTPTRASTSNAARRSTTTTTPSRRGTVDITDEELENGHELETMSASSSSIGLAASNSNASANALTDHGELIPFESTRPPGCSWCRDQSKLHRNPSQFKVSIRDGVKLISLGWRMRGFVNKERSVGRGMALTTSSDLERATAAPRGCSRAPPTHPYTDTNAYTCIHTPLLVPQSHSSIRSTGRWSWPTRACRLEASAAAPSLGTLPAAACCCLLLPVACCLCVELHVATSQR